MVNHLSSWGFCQIPGESDDKRNPKSSNEQEGLCKQHQVSQTILMAQEHD